MDDDRCEPGRTAFLQRHGWVAGARERGGERLPRIRMHKDIADARTGAQRESQAS